ncbi:oxidoreductase [Eremomyces bilateralis CBS 781.70]|uniref:Oxidoreductase n=1 Tax=Eremomyces bilateralis CBS 781.70 TaxID=1392243 RepID=A0A6G1FSV1_9PEZI|nr:oxidoreductase [Eremomyces bilateralis CBS 781.70]KAF1808761.1 oxidoreductase [Eremomyces bilateralis CBS 781.70]
MAETYYKGMFHGTIPTVTTDPNSLEAEAKKYLSSRSYAYVAGGAGERATMDANRSAFRAWKIVPRMLRDTQPQDLSTTVFGVKYPHPLFISPVGVQQIFHDDKETGMAQIAAELEVPYIMSTASTSSIEEVAQASGNGPRWYQLYWPQDEEITASILGRAKKNGFTALVVTLDTFSLSWRPWDLDSGYLPFLKGQGNQVPFSDPAFRAKVKKLTGKEVEEDTLAAYAIWAKETFTMGGHTWDDLAVLRKHWDGPIALKGIQCVEDAELAVKYGMQGIVVSNHGGRQVDGAVGSLEVLPEIVEAVGDKIDVLFDSGVRTGADVVKALCLGAKGVCIGRPWVYGLGIRGKEGAKEVLKYILADFDQTMGLSGIGSVKNCDKTWLRRSTAPTQASSN